MCIGPDERPFLDAIRASPRDDEPRLVYADFLDRADDPPTAARGELVRVQCALARLPADHPARPTLTNRQHDLLRDHLAAWTEPVRGLVAGVEFRRGVPDSVAVDAAVFVESGGELFRRLPVRRVRLLDAAKHVHRLVGCRFLRLVRELDVSSNDLGNGGVNVLLRSPHLAAVERLDLGFNGLDDAAARAVGRAATLPALRSLALNDGHVGDGGVAALAGSPHLSGLVALDLSGNAVDAAGVRALDRFDRLAAVRLGSNRVGADGAAALAGSPRSGRFRTLDLGSNALGDAGVADLASSPYLGRLRALGLSRNAVGDAGAVALARSPLAGRLAHLDVSHNRLTARGVRALLAARPAGRGGLDVAGNPLAISRADTPTPVGPVVDELVRALDATAALRRRIAHPARFAGRPPG